MACSGCESDSRKEGTDEPDARFLPPGRARRRPISGATDADLAAAWSTARELEAALPAESIMPSAGFADRVMASVALEPAPRSAGFLAVLRDRPGLAGLLASVREAWAVVAGGPGRPVRARGLALAYVLAVLVIGTSLTGVATYGAAGALGLLDGDASPTPTVQEIDPSRRRPRPRARRRAARRSHRRRRPPSPVEPTDSVEPSGSVEPDGSSGPDELDDHGGDTPAASDDGASSPEPSSGGDDTRPIRATRPARRTRPSPRRPRTDRIRRRRPRLRSD